MPSPRDGPRGRLGRDPRREAGRLVRRHAGLRRAPWLGAVRLRHAGARESRAPVPGNCGSSPSETAGVYALSSGSRAQVRALVSHSWYCSEVQPRSTTSRSWTASEQSVQTTSRASSTDSPTRRAPLPASSPTNRPWPFESPRLDLVPHRPELGVARHAVPQGPQERPRPAVDAGLRRDVQRDLATRIGLLDDRPDGGTLLDRGVARAVPPASTASITALKSAALTAETSVDRLDDDSRLGRDLRHRGARIAALAEQRAGGAEMSCRVWAACSRRRRESYRRRGLTSSVIW